MEHGAADLVLFQHYLHGLLLVNGGLPGAAALRIFRQGVLEILGQSYVIYHQAAGLVSEDPVHPGHRLHQAVSAHGLVQVHGVQAGRVKAGEPHVPHQHYPERIFRPAEAVGQRLPSGLVPDVLLPFRRIRCGTGHDHLYDSRLIAFVVPVGPQAHQLTV